MDFKHQIFDMINQLTGHDNIITLNVNFVDYTGDLETGLFLSQLIYWTGRGSRKDGFIFKTEKEWNEELRLSKYAIRKARKNLEKMGVLETKVKKAYGNPTVHYKLLKDEFVTQFYSFLRNQNNENTDTKEGNVENKRSLTDTTTHITTDINNKGEEQVTSLCYREIPLTDREREVIHHYMSLYERYRGKQHPNLKENQWSYVKDNLFYVVDPNSSADFDLSEDDLIDMIDKHFVTEYENCDYNILHFMSDGVRVNRMYEVAY